MRWPILYALVAPLALLGSIAPISAEGAKCFPCKLHGSCPFPSLAELKACLPDEGNSATVEAPPKVANDWVVTPCGRIRHSDADREASSR